MAICDICKREMLQAGSCIENSTLRFSPKRGVRGKSTDYPKIKNGEEKRSYGDRSQCHDCGVKVGGIHHSGCDWEECPRCGGQLISCSCNEECVVSDVFVPVAA